MAIYTVGVGQDYINIKALVDAAVLITGDEIHLSGIIDDTASGEIAPTYYATLHFLKKPGDIDKPIVKLGATSNLYFYYPTFNFTDIKFEGAARTAPSMLQGVNAGTAIRCEIYDTDYTNADPDVTIGQLATNYEDCVFRDFLGIIYQDSFMEQMFNRCLFYNLGHGRNNPILRLHDRDLSIINCIFRNIGQGVVNNDSNDPYNATILNNTVFSFGESYAATAFALDDTAYTLKMFNNIIHGNSNPNTIAISYSSLSTEQDYNCIHGCATEYAGIAATAPNNIDATNNPGATDPLFTNAGTGDFTLLDASPCIDAGAGTSVHVDIPIVDITGADRPLAPLAGWDMGAYERALPPPTSCSPRNYCSAY